MSASEQVLPASRQPVPVAPDVQAEIDRKPRTAAQIEHDIAERGERLAANIDELTARLSPSRLVRSADGRLRMEIVGALAGVAVAVGLLIWRAKRR